MKFLVTFLLLTIFNLQLSYRMTFSNDVDNAPTPPSVIPLIINGKEELTPSTFDVISPYTNEPCWAASSATPQDAIRAVEAAEAAFPAWSQTKPNVRRDILLKAADILESRLVQNAEYMRTEMGADVGASQFFIVPMGIRMLRETATRITSICGSVPVVEEEGQSAIIYKEPMGVILGIVPWYVHCGEWHFGFLDSYTNHRGCGTVGMRRMCLGSDPQRMRSLLVTLLF